MSVIVRIESEIEHRDLSGVVRILPAGRDEPGMSASIIAFGKRKLRICSQVSHNGVPSCCALHCIPDIGRTVANHASQRNCRFDISHRFVGIVANVAIDGSKTIEAKHSSPPRITRDHHRARRVNVGCVCNAQDIRPRVSVGIREIRWVAGSEKMPDARGPHRMTAS